MIPSLIARPIILLLGAVYPAYRSYKAIKNKNVDEYAKCCKYWVVFALFYTAESFTDTIFSWTPFYVECKILLLVWLSLPLTKGASIVYSKFIDPLLSQREKEIDEFVDNLSAQTGASLLQLARRAVNLATSYVVETATRRPSVLRPRIKKVRVEKDKPARKREEGADTHKEDDSQLADADPKDEAKAQEA